MKNAVKILILIFLSGGAYAQTYPYLKFRKPTTSNNVTYRFSSVYTGVDALVSIINTKNATVDRIDDSSKYAHAWNPWIRFTNSAGSTDSSYVEFKIDFVQSGTNTLKSFDNMAMTIVDLDGNGIGSYREMVKTSLPATPVGILGSTLSTVTSLTNLTLISGVITYPNTDTSNFAAMSQINYSNVNSYTLKVGALGNVNSNAVRQFSFYYKPFQSMVFVLPVKLINLQVVSNNEVPEVKWTTTSEDNCSRFEVYRSIDGVNYQMAGMLEAKGGNQSISDYSFVDASLYGQNQSKVFYKIRIVDHNGDHSWTSVLHYGVVPVSTSSTISHVYPNPANSIITVNFSTISEEGFTLELIDMFGKSYSQVNNSKLTGSNQLSLDVSHLNSGIYFVKIIEANGHSSMSQFFKN